MRAITGRQRQLLAMIAQGMTNKAIAREEGVSERAVTSQVTRLLARYGVVNRASLVARVVAERPPSGGRSRDTPPVSFMWSMLRDLDVYTRLPLAVFATVGREQSLAYVNDFTKRLVTPGTIQDLLGRPWQRAWGHSTVSALYAISEEVYRTGQVRSIANHDMNWPRGDGSWMHACISCVAQAIRESDEVRGVLWICTLT